MSKLGLVGIGAMGSPMARKLLDAGHRLYIHDIEPGRATALSKTRAIVCDSAAEVARQADIVFLMVGTAQDVEKAIFGPRGAIGQLREGSLVVCMSTMPAADARLAAARLAERAVGFLDAPVSGGTSGARDGSLSIMVGGEREDFDTALPYLQAMGRNITLVGGHGSGQTAKAANQIIVSVTRAAVGEALLFAKRDGCDPEQVRRALLGGYAQSHTLENYGKRQAQQDNPVEFGSAILKKDLDYIAGTAKDLGITLPLTSLVRRMYNQS
jgi:2-hydroxy-3-oxopropionate reductase